MTTPKPKTRRINRPGNVSKGMKGSMSAKQAHQMIKAKKRIQAGKNRIARYKNR